MKTLFITPGPIEWASSRMRAHWPAKYMDADVMEYEKIKIPEWWPNIPLQYDAYVFVKVLDPGLSPILIENGKQVWWDICDPAWWMQPKQSLEIAKSVTGIVASNQALADDFNQWAQRSGVDNLPVAQTIPDRLELSHYPRQRTHADVDPVRIIWYGAAQNRVNIFAALINLERLVANGYHIELTIMDDQPDNDWGFSIMFPIYYTRWNLAQENEIIANHDIALVPPYPGAWGKVKSNNRALTAWACGLPAVSGTNYGELESHVRNAKAREYGANLGRSFLSDFDVRQSAEQWQELLNVQR